VSCRHISYYPHAPIICGGGGGGGGGGGIGCHMWIRVMWTRMPTASKVNNDGDDDDDDASSWCWW